MRKVRWAGLTRAPVLQAGPRLVWLRALGLDRGFLWWLARIGGILFQSWPNQRSGLRLSRVLKEGLARRRWERSMQANEGLHEHQRRQSELQKPSQTDQVNAFWNGGDHGTVHRRATSNPRRWLFFITQSDNVLDSPRGRSPARFLMGQRLLERRNEEICSEELICVHQLWMVQKNNLNEWVHPP